MISLVLNFSDSQKYCTNKTFIQKYHLYNDRSSSDFFLLFWNGKIDCSEARYSTLKFCIKIILVQQYLRIYKYNDHSPRFSIGSIKQTLCAHKILLALIDRKVKLIWLSLVNQIVFSINFVIIKIKWIDNIVHWKKCVDKHDIARSLSNFAANNGRNARFKWYFVGHLGCLICHHTFIWKANVSILTFDKG